MKTFLTTGNHNAIRAAARCLHSGERWPLPKALWFLDCLLFKLCCTLPGVHYLECFTLVVSRIFTEQFMFSLSFLKNRRLEFTKVIQSMEPKDKNLHKTTKIPSFFFCIPVFHSSFLYLAYPTIFCNFFTLSACRVKAKN